MHKAPKQGKRRIVEQRKRHRGQDKPLPFDYQIHPQDAEPTFRQPAHTESYSTMDWCREYTAKLSTTTKGLFNFAPADYLVTENGEVLSYFTSLAEASGFSQAANRLFINKYQAWVTDTFIEVISDGQT
jgi:hypothetical protein